MHCNHTYLLFPCRSRRKEALTPSSRPVTNSSAFTLLELLVVLAIIGIVTAIALPGLKGMRQSNVVESAARQLMDDLALARGRAISTRSVVHMVFVPPGIDQIAFNNNDVIDRKTYTNILSGPYTTYGFFTERSIGDQPGQPRFNYILNWRSLPEGVMIAPWEYNDNYLKALNQWVTMDPTNRPLQWAVLPFPSRAGFSNAVPHIAFDPQGSLIVYGPKGRELQDECINLAQGSLLVQRDEATGAATVDALERPANNSINNFIRIRIDALTGRTKLERPQLQ